MKPASIARALLAGVALAAGSLVTVGAHANLIINGDFEAGDYTGWIANVQPGSEGGLTVVPNNGGASTFSSLPYQLNPTGENFFSISDQTGPGSYSLTQSFTLLSPTTVNVSFQMFANNWLGEVFNNGRDFTTSNLNQNAVVDILSGGADPFTNSSGDIVAVLYGPGADNLDGPNPWQSYSINLSLAAGTYQIRFAETDNQF